MQTLTQALDALRLERDARQLERDTLQQLLQEMVDNNGKQQQPLLIPFRNQFNEVIIPLFFSNQSEPALTLPQLRCHRLQPSLRHPPVPLTPKGCPRQVVWRHQSQPVSRSCSRDWWS